MVKKALVVGLNYPSQTHQLYGCVNDALNWVAVLEKQFQFEEVRVLIDQNPDGSITTYPTQIPTKHNILAQLGWLCSGVQQGDTLVFVFAGHGTQVRTGTQYADEALVPEDFSTKDDRGNPTLVFDDELHALFKRLPSGSFITAILDCCHATHMLDVPSCIEGGKAHQSRARPLEVTKRLEHAWTKNPHAYARPRFITPVSWSGKRHTRTEPGSGQHVGRMNLDPGVTAFCFAACSTHEVALDANIKAQQQGTMSFCLQEALVALHNTCTYERLLEKAAEIGNDIRSKYMPTMDQNFHLSFCPYGPPSEVVFLDERYATVSQHRLSEKKKQQGAAVTQLSRQQSAPREQHQQPGNLPREASSDFIPAPMYSGHQHAAPQKEPITPDRREPSSPCPRPASREDIRSPMPNHDPLAAYGMGPASLGLSTPMSSQAPGIASYAGMPSIAELSMGSSPQPDRNIFGMPNLFGGFGSGASGAGSAAGAAGSNEAAPNLFGNLFGGGGGMFGAGGQKPPSPFSSQQPATGLLPPAGLLQQPISGAFASGFSSQAPGGFSSQAGGFSSQVGGFSAQAGGFSSQAGGFSSQAGGFSSQAGGLSSQAGGFSSQQGAFSSQMPAGGMQAGPSRTPSGFGSGLGNALGMGGGITGRSAANPHVNAYASGAAYTGGATAAFPQGYAI